MKSAVILIACIIAGAFASPSDNRVIGGEIAANEQFPYLVSIRVNGGHNCGGSIISDIHILTAAHCLKNTPPSALTVVTGSNTLNAGGDTYQVQSYVFPDDFTTETYYNDVAVVKLTSKIVFSRKVQKISLNTDPIPAGTDMVTAGWGWEYYPDGVAPNQMKFVWVQAVNTTDCASKLQNINESKLCVFKSTGQGICKGDSGGPLVVNGKVAGITCWAILCARGYPDVFTRVSFFNNWITSHMN